MSDSNKYNKGNKRKVVVGRNANFVGWQAPKTSTDVDFAKWKHAAFGQHVNKETSFCCINSPTKNVLVWSSLRHVTT